MPAQLYVIINNPLIITSLYRPAKKIPILVLLDKEVYMQCLRSLNKLLAVIAVLLLIACRASGLSQNTSTPTLIPPTVVSTSPPTNTPPTSNVLCPPPKAEGPGVFLGSSSAPMPEMDGVLVKAMSTTPPINLVATDIKIKLLKVYYRGQVTGSYVQPSEGSVETLFVGDKNIEMVSGDFSSGCIRTKEFGFMPILFDANMFGGGGYLVVTPEQFDQLNKP